MTTGLDPAARRATWGLIEQIRDAGTTVVLVTHFMDEAERLCDRLAVVDRGSIVASGTPAELVAASVDTVHVRVSVGDADPVFLEQVPGVLAVERRGSRVYITGAPTIPPRIGKALVDRGLEPDDMEVIRPTLEDVYLRLVGEES
jgi:ABC-2 type transport system ATP-binding protein